MATTVEGWTTLAENPPVLVREYFWGGGLANAVAVGLPDNKLLILSPPSGLTDDELRKLSAAGDVIAVITNNGSHYLGIAQALRVFPGSVSYGAPSAAARIKGRVKDCGDLKPTAELHSLLGDKVEVLEVPATKLGDVILRVHTEKGALVYLSDLVANIPVVKGNFVVKAIMRWTDSAPGLKVFRIFFTFFVSDKAATRDYLVRELEAHSPTVFVPAHGDVIERADIGATLVSMLRAAY
jgi:hypothetical protein